VLFTDYIWVVSGIEISFVSECAKAEEAVH